MNRRIKLNAIKKITPKNNLKIIASSKIFVLLFTTKSLTTILFNPRFNITAIGLIKESKNLYSPNNCVPKKLATIIVPIKSKGEAITNCPTFQKKFWEYLFTKSDLMLPLGLE